MSTANAVAVSEPGRWRLLRVWWLVARVLLSYGGLGMAAWLRGAAWKKQALPQLHRRNARRIKATIFEVQGLFIKVGQLISVLSNFLPADFRRELEALQDRLPPRPLSGIQARLRQELGDEPERLFARFDPEPLASASLAQVHAATLFDGRRVAVKVQHPDIEQTARRDLATVRHILRLVELLLGVRGLREVHRQIAALIEEELDFRREAESLAAIAANFAGDSEVGFPTLVPELSTRRVLVTELIAGVKVVDETALAAAGIDRRQLAERVLRTYCRMIFQHGLYHADPHPGNLFVQPDGRLVFVDFGAVGRLSPVMKEGLSRLVEAVLRRDTEQILAALSTMGFLARNADSAEVASMVIDYVYSHLLSGLEIESLNLKDIQFDPKLKLEMLADLAKMDLSLRQLTSTFQVPREWILLERTLLLLMGVCTQLDPDMKPMAVVRPYVQEFVLGERDWLDFARSLLKNLALSALTLPEDVRSVLRMARRGELEVNVHGLPESARLLYAAHHQLLWAVLALGSGTLAYVARRADDPPFALGFAAAAGIFLLCLGGSLWRARRLVHQRRRPRS